MTKIPQHLLTPALLAPYLQAVTQEYNQRLTPPVGAPPQK
ncbi:hypothetical protein HNQ93_003312 [Hymenobacter luteus]|uniref:Uncharacterized protein n=2 Tax=Hymenobacter TaxID=89966 RepID=A0A7W9T480_9BACT|nr:hypothetical protein [Hymenobacter latericoloratus]MBB6060438.1 hypothetical protein [Hymenobacter luteus]